jgi:predicted membrane protein (TIGR00267 family)
MGLSEGLSDDGSITGRGDAVTRGLITGFATFVGGFAHALPFLISDVHTALAVAYPVVGAELLLIAWIRKRFQNVSLRLSLIQVTLGGVLVAAVGFIVGHA